MPLFGRRRRGDSEVVQRPRGWPQWLPVEGGHRGRDILPTHTYWDLSRLFHRAPATPDTDGWPTPVRPGLEQTSLCDALGRTVDPVPAPGPDQARQLLSALGTDAPVHALLAGTTDRVLDEAAANGWPVVDGRHVQPELADRRVVLVRDLDPDDAVQRLAAGDVSHLWSDTWLVRCDPWGNATSSSLVAGVHGTAERLRHSGLDVLPIGHAYAWPPPCHTCGTGHGPS